MTPVARRAPMGRRGCGRTWSRPAGRCRSTPWPPRWPARAWSGGPRNASAGRLTRPDKAAAPIPDLVRRDFSTGPVDQRWCGDLTEIPTGEGKLYLAIVLDLGSRRLPGFAMSEHHDSAVAKAALCMAAAVRGGDVDGVIFHSDKGGEYVGDLFTKACDSARGDPVDGPGRLGVGQRRLRELELDPRARAVVAEHVRDQRPGPPGCRPVHRRLQHPPAPQQLRDAPTRRLRTAPRRASRPTTRPGSMNHRLARWRQPATSCEAATPIRNPPRLRGKPTLTTSPT